MAARNLPAIKRVRQTRYVASDGKSFESHVEAFRHETFLTLIAFLHGSAALYGGDSERLAKELLSAEDFRIVLLGPRTGTREVAQ